MVTTASQCIEDAESYRGNMVQVVETKQAIVVAFFLAYLVFEVSIFFKHCF